jgi:hypothetical protein
MAVGIFPEQRSFQERLGQFFDIQWHSVGLSDNVCHYLGREGFAAGQPGDQRFDLRPLQTIQRQRCQV